MFGAVSWVPIGALAAGGALCALVSVLWQYREEPGARWFIAALSAQAAWCLAYGVALFVVDPQVRFALEVASVLAISWVGYLFLGFALEYTGHGAIRQSRFYALLGGVPLVGTALLLTNPWHTLFWENARLTRAYGSVVLEYSFEFGGYAVLVTGLLYAGVGVFLLAETILSYGPLYRSEAAAVAVSTLPPAVGIVVWLAGLGSASVIQWGTVLSLPHAALDAYAFVGKRMFETSPATRRVADEQAIDALPHPVVVIDDSERLVDFNTEAEVVFEDVTPEAAGTHVSEVFAFDATKLRGEETSYLTVAGGESRREFAVHSSPLRDAAGATVGHTVLFLDVTDEREREQRLEVLTRVLRHNLRNKLTAVMGYATTIEAETDDEQIREFADRIERNGADLTEIGEKARAFDQLQQSDPHYRPVRVERVLDSVATDLTERYAGATVDVDVDADVRVITDADHLRLALENVIENAIEHSGVSNPTVWIDIGFEDGGETLRIDVRDEGPGIPDTEIGVLASGSESRLDHGSGIGLWIVEWSLRRIGGSVSFEQSETGTRVRLLIPDRSPPRGTADVGSRQSA
nr:histidine kinase N-terminal 7TM domain-containing protein [Halobellus rarus]